MTKWLKGGIFGGIVLFIWGAISWTVLDWHISTFKKFPDESVATSFISEIPKSGMYVLPLSFKLSDTTSESDKTDNTKKYKDNSPIVFAAIWKDGANTNMLQQLIVSLISQIIAALLVTGIVLLRPHTQFSGRFFQVMLFAVAAAIVTHIPYMNWFYFTSYYTFINILDLLIGWFMAAFVISYVTRPKYPNFY